VEAEVTEIGVALVGDALGDFLGPFDGRQSPADAGEGYKDLEFVVQEHSHFVALQAWLLDESVAERGEHRWSDASSPSSTVCWRFRPAKYPKVSGYVANCAITATSDRGPSSSMSRIRSSCDTARLGAI
jgi:hypothetical protein